MDKTIARKKFKTEFWQTNHFLITSLIWIDSIEKWLVKEKPIDFSTSWNPKDIKRSCERSRIFILKSFLWWTVDALDMYIQSLRKKPNYFFNDSKATSIIDGAGNSVYNKAINLWDYLKIDKVLVSLIDILITWRNNVIHYYWENNLLKETEKVIKDNEETIKREYCWIEISSIFNKVKKWDILTFKEVASLIKATHNFVEQIDKKVIAKLNLDDFCYEILIEEFKNNSNFRKKLYSLKKERKKEFLNNFLKINIWIDESDYKLIEKCYELLN